MPIFSQTLQEVDPRDASFRASAPLRTDLRGVGSTVENIAGAVVIGKANKDISQEQQAYLQGASANEQLEVQRAEAVRVGETSVEDNVVADARAKVEKLTQAIDSNRVDPYVALNRIETIKRKAAALAPSFVSNIMALGGTPGSATGGGFNTQVQRAITLEQELDDAAIELGYNPNDPMARVAVIEKRQLDAAADRVQKQEIVEGPQVKEVADNVISNTIDTWGNRFSAINLDDLGEEQKLQVIDQFGSNTDVDVARVTALGILRESIGSTATSKLPEADINQYANYIKGQADRFMQVANGELEAKYLASKNTLSDSRALYDFTQEYPTESAALSILKQAGTSLAGSAIAGRVGNTLLRMVEAEAKSIPSSELATPQEQVVGATSAKALRLEITSKDMPKDVVAGQAKLYANAFKSSLRLPDSMAAQHTAVYDEKFAGLADAKFWDKLKDGADAETISSIANSFNEYSIQYTQRKLVPDMQAALADATVSIRGTTTSRGLRDVVKVPAVKLTTSTDGTIQFSPALSDNTRAVEQARRLQALFGDRYNNIIKAYINIHGAADSKQFSEGVR